MQNFRDILVLSVKSNRYKVIIEEIKDLVKNEVVIVTIAAGRKIRNEWKLESKKLGGILHAV